MEAEEEKTSLGRKMYVSSVEAPPPLLRLRGKVVVQFLLEEEVFLPYSSSLLQWKFF